MNLEMLTSQDMLVVYIHGVDLSQFRLTRKHHFQLKLVQRRAGVTSSFSQNSDRSRNAAYVHSASPDLH